MLINSKKLIALGIGGMCLLGWNPVFAAQQGVQTKEVKAQEIQPRIKQSFTEVCPLGRWTPIVNDRNILNAEVEVVVEGLGKNVDMVDVRIEKGDGSTSIERGLKENGYFTFNVSACKGYKLLVYPYGGSGAVTLYVSDRGF
ncbi:MAG: hypothetical protein AB9856_10745 [Cellulosilyticaceae bacterium]